ncbi:MAG: DUF92 domain-containing protein [Candidatus Marinimicrobia bacterium]|nr:DUF92 domain-containing protein [Candidatus Neomarinimicrobiota bacterium]
MEFLQNINQWIIFLIFFFSLVGLVALSGILLEKFKVSENTTRRFVHIGVGLLVSISPFLFDDFYPAALLAVIFIVLNWLALVKDKARGMHSTSRKSYGTVFFPVSFLVLILLFWNSNTTALIMGMLLMAISDPFASFVGESKLGGKTFVPWADKKSVGGTLAAFFSNMLLLLVFVPLLSPSFEVGLVFWVMVLNVALVATISEIISKAGTDNLTLPIFSAIILDLTMQLDLNGNLWVLFWLVISVLFVSLAYQMKSLSVSGAFGAALMGMFIFGIGGADWMLPMASFFVLASLVSKIGKKKKEGARLMAEKHDVRDIYQVYANAGIGLVCVILFQFTQKDYFYLAYLASLAAAAADTWATEIGTLLGRKPRKITTLRHCLTGESGGITIPGILAALTGAFSIGFTGFLISGLVNVKILLALVLAGFAGSLVDSLLGATLQSQYRCVTCHKITEKRIHCDQKTILFKGFPWINNDFVNLVCTLSGAVVMLILIRIL